MHICSDAKGLDSFLGCWLGRIWGCFLSCLDMGADSPNSCVGSLVSPYGQKFWLLLCSFGGFAPLRAIALLAPQLLQRFDVWFHFGRFRIDTSFNIYFG